MCLKSIKQGKLIVVICWVHILPYHWFATINYQLVYIFATGTWQQNNKLALMSFMLLHYSDDVQVVETSSASSSLATLRVND